MSDHQNDFGQDIGFPMNDWKACVSPNTDKMKGRYCRLETLDPDQHAQDLYNAFCGNEHNRNWTYLPYGPFDDFTAFNDWLTSVSKPNDPLFFTIIDLKTNTPLGIASYLRIVPAHGAIEVGHIHFSSQLQKTPIATEAMYLMMKRVFDELGYRRYEWKCDALNGPSKQAAQRLEFQYEGTFRQALVYKGRNRDTAWFSITDREWAGIKVAFEKWLDPSNFDAAGTQLSRLETTTF